MTNTTEVKRPLAAVTLPLVDWAHVVNAVESSFQRKRKRGEHRKADEMSIIAVAIMEQIKRGLK